jgi:hypothetical protein
MKAKAAAQPLLVTRQHLKPCKRVPSIVTILLNTFFYRIQLGEKLGGGGGGEEKKKKKKTKSKNNK